MKMKFWNRLQRFHEDERGLETVQTLVIVAIAGVCLIAVKLWWGWYSKYFKLAVEILVEN